MNIKRHTCFSSNKKIIIKNDRNYIFLRLIIFFLFIMFYSGFLEKIRVDTRGTLVHASSKTILTVVMARETLERYVYELGRAFISALL